MKIRTTFLILDMVATLANPLSAQAAPLSEDMEQLAKAIVQQQRAPLTPAERAEMPLDVQADFDQKLFLLTNIYQEAFKQGVQAGLKNQWQPNYKDEVALAGYQAGFNLGKNLQEKDKSASDRVINVKPSQPASKDKVVIPVNDEPEGVGDSIPEITPSVTEDAQVQTDNTDYSNQVPTPSRQAFIEKIAPVAQEIAAAHDLYPSVLIAQAALESDFGSSDLARQHHNYFGIKGFFQSQGVSLPTVEHLNGRDIKVMGTFRHYPNDMASLEDYASVLNQPLYVNVHRKFASTYRQATYALTGKYATDPNYNRKLNAIIEGYGLTKYDYGKRTGESGRSKSNKAQVNQPSTKYHPNKPGTSAVGPVKTDWTLPMVSGAGSVGILELIRRMWR